MKRWHIALLITSAIFAVGIAVWRYTAPERHVSDLYRRYEHADGIAASYIHNYPVNDTLTLTLDLTSRPQATYLLTLTTADGKQHTVRLLKQSDIFDK